MKIPDNFSKALIIGFIVLGLSTCYHHQEKTERMRLLLEHQCSINSKNEVDN